jgi:hypothetical protein
MRGEDTQRKTLSGNGPQSTRHGHWLIRQQPRKAAVSHDRTHAAEGATATLGNAAQADAQRMLRPRALR